MRNVQTVDGVNTMNEYTIGKDIKDLEIRMAFLEEKLEALKEALEQFDTPKEGNDGESRPTE